jgi:hypothetical protein
MPGHTFKTSKFHWAVSNYERLWQGIEEVFASVPRSGFHSADNVVTWGKALGFLDDQAFTSAWAKHAELPHERGIIWRTAVLVWAARQALRRDGDFVECGCCAGTSMRIVMDAVGLKDRRVFLYDLFEHDETMAHQSMPDHGPDLLDRVRVRFANDPNVSVIKGCVPQSFEQGVPEKVAFAHIDMNAVEPEIGALNALEPRFAPGAVIVLDDFGHLAFADQHVAERAWFAERGLPILEIPTGQGIVIW